MLDLDSTSLIVIVVISLMAGVVKVGFGVGAGAFLTPILALFLPAKVAVGLMAPVMIVTDLSAIHHHWRKWHSRHVLVMLPTCLVGVVVGSLFLAWAPSALVRKAIGVVALLFVALQLSSLVLQSGRPSVPMPTWAGWIIGFVAGITNSVAHSGGIVLSIYLLTAGLAKSAFISTLVTIFIAANLFKFPIYWQTGIVNMPILLTGLALTPAMLIGGQMGAVVTRRLSVRQFSRLVVLLVGLSGVLLLTT